MAVVGGGGGGGEARRSDLNRLLLFPFFFLVSLVVFVVFGPVMDGDDADEMVDDTVLLSPKLVLLLFLFLFLFVLRLARSSCRLLPVVSDNTDRELVFSIEESPLPPPPPTPL